MVKIENIFLIWVIVLIIVFGFVGTSTSANDTNATNTSQNITMDSSAVTAMINHGLQNTVFNVTMPVITNAGTDAFWLIICAGLFIFGGEKGRNVAILGIIALLFGYVLSEFIKYEVARPRPYTVLSNVHLLTTMIIDDLGFSIVYIHIILQIIF